MVPNNYNVNEVMKDLAKRNEQVMGIVHRAILIKTSMYGSRNYL